MAHPELPEFFYEIFHHSLPRHGPGEEASTARALATLQDLELHRALSAGPGQLRILDLGCGAGTQTLHLAQRIDAPILAVDNHQPFLDELDRRAQAAGITNIQTRLGDMFALDLEQESFDLIWSEGALFVPGFGQGLTTCRGLLAPGGMLAATELTWFKPDPPVEIRDFFAQVYPAIQSVQANLDLIASLGFESLGHFSLPVTAWTECFYDHLEARLPLLRSNEAGNEENLALIENIQKEIDLYRKYADCYGYEFYLMKRQD